MSCPLCHESRATHELSADEYLRRSRRYELVRCAGCGHVFVSPQPSSADLEGFYSSVVPLLRARFPAPEPYEQVADAPAELEKVGLIERLGLASGRVLDVGFGNAGFLLALEKRGWRCAGVEFTDKVPLPAACAARFELWLGDDALDRLPENSFDLVTLWHVLEHLREPVRDLARVRRALRPNGTMLVAVPNYEGLSARVFGSHWDGLSPPWHLHQFRPRTLSLALAEAGYRVSSVQAFGDHAMYLLWLNSFTHLMDTMPGWAGPLRQALRVGRRLAAASNPILRRVEERVGRPGAIVAIAQRNDLVGSKEAAA
jgi:SAM-dependent methyltransferase